MQNAPLQGEHSAILSTFIKLPFVIKIFVLSICEWPLKTGFTVINLFLERLGRVVKVCLLQVKLLFFSEMANNYGADHDQTV